MWAGSDHVCGHQYQRNYLRMCERWSYSVNWHPRRIISLKIKRGDYIFKTTTNSKSHEKAWPSSKFFFSLFFLIPVSHSPTRDVIANLRGIWPVSKCAMTCQQTNQENMRLSSLLGFPRSNKSPWIIGRARLKLSWSLFILGNACSVLKRARGFLVPYDNSLFDTHSIINTLKPREPTTTLKPTINTSGGL